MRGVAMDEFLRKTYLERRAYQRRVAGEMSRIKKTGSHVKSINYLSPTIMSIVFDLGSAEFSGLEDG